MSDIQKWWIDDVEERVCGRVDHPKIGLDKIPWPDCDKVHIVMLVSDHEKELATLRVESERMKDNTLAACLPMIEHYEKENEKLRAKVDLLKNSTQLPKCGECEKMKVEIEELKKEARKELSEKDKRLAHLESEVTRVFDPTRKFWNNEREHENQQLRELVNEAETIIEDTYPGVPPVKQYNWLKKKKEVMQ